MAGTDRFQPIDLKSISLKDLAKEALSELGSVKQELEEQRHPVVGAIDNLRLIERLRTLPAVEHLLRLKETEIVIIPANILNMRRNGLLVSSNGLQITYYSANDTLHSNARGQNVETPYKPDAPEIDEDLIRNLWETNLRGNRRFIQDVAKLDPDQIIDKFRSVIY